MALSTITARDGNNAAITVPALADASGNVSSMVSLDSSRPTYRSSASSTAVITTAAGTILTVTGSATKTIRIKKIVFCLTAGTPVQCVLQLQRVSAIGINGTVVTPTVSKLDTGSAAATGVVSHYITTKQTNGTAVGGPMGTIGVSEILTTTISTVQIMNQFLFPEGGFNNGQSIVLRGVADILEVQNPVAIGTTPAFSYMVEWEEDAS